MVELPIELVGLMRPVRCIDAAEQKEAAAIEGPPDIIPKGLIPKFPILKVAICTLLRKFYPSSLAKTTIFMRAEIRHPQKALLRLRTTYVV